jgi:3-oxoacyl-[acyl-carrier-protein] synthase II
MSDSVVITGVGLISPLGDNMSDFLDNIYMNNSGISEIKLFDTTDYKCKLAAGINDFDAEKYLGKKGLRYMDRSTKLLLTASQFTINDSGYPLKGESDSEIGVVAGNTLGSAKSISEYDRISILESPTNVSPTDFANCVINSATGNVGIKFNAMCINVTMSNGISSSLDSFGYAYDFINLKRAKMLMVGGVEELCEETFYGFYKLGLLDPKEDIQQLKGQYDSSEGGIILGEGSALFTLEAYKAAKERGANIYAQVAGYGRYFNDGTNQVKSMVRCMQKAIEDSCIDVSEIDAVIASFNGYTTNDMFEAEALEEVFKTYPDTIPVTAIKGYTGECYSASGAFQVATAIGMLQRGEIPAATKCVDYISVNSKLQFLKSNGKKPINTILINSFGFSGGNTSLILKRIQ